MKAVFLFVGLAVVLAIVRFGLAAASRPDDQKLIRQALAESIQASKEGRPGGVMDFISDKFQINGNDPGTRRQIAEFIKNSRPDVSVENQVAVITGDQAVITSPVGLSIDWLGRRLSRRLNPLTIRFQKEDATEYLVIPTRKWRLIDVQVPENAAAEFLQ